MNRQSTRALLIPRDAVPMDLFSSCAVEPDTALIFEIDIDASPGQKDIALTYSKVCKLEGLTDRDSFHQVMREIINGSEKPTWKKPKRTPDLNSGQGHARTKDTRLSINFEDKSACYLVFKLNPQRNWQFASEFWPFMIAANDSGKCLFSDAQRFDRTGQLAEFHDDPYKDKLIDHCVYAYFVVDGSNLGSASSTEFQHRFNIHIELFELDATNNIDNRIPIIIDPDVRHPGGNSNP